MSAAAGSIVFLDTETTCLGSRARPWEIAVIRRELLPIPDGRPQTSIAEVVLHVEYDVPTLPPGTTAKALEVGRWLARGAPGATYLDEVNADGVNVSAGSEAEVALELAGLFGDEPLLVGVGVHFDAAVLGSMFLRHRLPEEPWHYGLVDLKAATWGYLRYLSRVAVLTEDERAALALPLSSERLSRAVGIDPPTGEERHTALGDARWAARWYDALAGGAA